MKNFIKKTFKIYSYVLGVITPLFILNYIMYKHNNELTSSEIDLENLDIEKIINYLTK